MARTIGIGHQDFERLIQDDLFYIDKTNFIKEWWEHKDIVTLITRPRRFGKTLNMSMVEQFFSTTHAGKEELFKGLSIWKEKKYRQLQGTYPVISLSFANVKDSCFSNTRQKLCQLIATLYAKYTFLLEGNYLTEEEKITFHRKSMNMGDVDATLALNQLSDFLYRYYGKKVIILLDEYDTPMQEAYIHGYWDELVSFMRSLFNATFKTNAYLEKAIMTGITRVSKESIFSDLNNLEVVTSTSDKYEESFGFTQQEVLDVLKEYGLSDQKEKVKDWYDGFTFGKKTDIYNPWSILNFLDKRSLSTYWVHTSSNGLVGKLIREGSPDVKTTMEDLLKGKSLRTQIDEQLVFNQLDHNEYAIWSLLLASGYLKIAHYEMNEEKGRIEYDLALTNKEVRIMFEQMIEEWFARFTPSYNAFIKALLQDDKKAMNHYMNRVAMATFSYFDTGNKPSEFVEPERFYHGFVLGLMVDLADRYIITSNRESGFGRYDVLLEPKTPNDNGIILEFKVHDPEDEKNLQDTVKSALQQIDEKQYASTLIAKGILPEKIRKYGFAFEGKKVLIG